MTMSTVTHFYFVSAMLLLGYILYLFYYGRYLYGILAFYCFSLLYVTLLPFIFVSARLFLHFTQIGIRFLSFVSSTLRPLVDYLSSTRYIGATFEWLFRVNFFLSFCCLIISDAVLRKVVSRFVGKHSTGKHYSLVNAWSPKFEGGIFDEAMEQEQNRDPQKESESMNHESCTNSYSPAICYSLSTAAQLCYEGISIVKHELRAAGFDVDNTFHPIHYKNTYGYVCTKGKTVIVVFRGTQPLNVSNVTTDLQLGMVDGSCIPGSGIGMIHRGFLDALGSTDIPPAFSHISSVPSTPITSTMHISTGHPAPTLQISMTSSSLLNVIKSTASALWKIFSWLIVHLLHQVNHPGENLIRGINLRDLHGQSTFVQASVSIERAIRSLEKKGVKRDEIKLYITGHSLGAAIAYLFLAKLTERNSPLLPNFASLYTFGSPRVGCANFATYLGSRYPNQIFRVVHNNDIVPRVPPSDYSYYHEPPGSLVFIQSSGAISVSPPYLGPKENVQACLSQFEDQRNLSHMQFTNLGQTFQRNHEIIFRSYSPPPPVRGIKFLHLSGVLNANVLKRMKNETLPRVVLRFCLPFFLDDHLPDNYTFHLGNTPSVLKLKQFISTQPSTTVSSYIPSSTFTHDYKLLNNSLASLKLRDPKSHYDSDSDPPSPTSTSVLPPYSLSDPRYPYNSEKLYNNGVSTDDEAIGTDVSSEYSSETKTEMTIGLDEVKGKLQRIAELDVDFVSERELRKRWN